MSDDLEIKPHEESGPIPFAAPGRGGNVTAPRSPRVSPDAAGGGPPRDLNGGSGPKRWRGRRRRRERPPKPRVRKLRLALILIGLAALALVSTVFGMMMAVASDLPQLENRAEYKKAANSFLYDDRWRPIGIFAPPNNVVIDRFDQVSPWMRRGIVAVEDRRFWTDPGVDIKGIARAFLTDVTGGSRQGGSTIAQQFVKNALSEENNRTVFEKLREAALAYHLTREWKKKKILIEYLNSIYFGNGAYGIESAARVYFGRVHGYTSATSASTTTADQSTSSTTSGSGCGDGNLPKCASLLTPPEAALLAGMVASPSAFDPIAHPGAARDRRNLVLQDMFEQHLITRAEYFNGVASPLPTAKDIQQPDEPTVAPYFTSWLRPQILAAVGLGHGVPANVAEYRAYYGGLKVRTTLDLSMQRAAERAVSAALPSGYGLPSASLVAIDNRTGEVRAMVGGPLIKGQQDYKDYPFNIATEGHRQPGSAFKPFTLAMALESGRYGPDSIIDSAPQNFIVPNSAGKEHFIVHNFGNAYSGPITLADATANSDNSVYSQVGINVGTKRIARLAKRMGIRSPVSNNYAMILGGLREGVTPLDLAHAYETFATGGLRVYNPKLGTPHAGPTGISQIDCPAHVCRGSSKVLVDKPTYKRVLPAPIAATVHELLQGVVQHGTGTNAAISGVDVAGKTGTTTNYGDAWFVGWTPELTTAVWVGYPNKLVPMATDYHGQPVEGGTYPAIIWQSFMTQALQIWASENPHAKQPGATESTTTSSSGYAVGTSTATTTSPVTGTTGSAGVTGTTGTIGTTGVTAGGGTVGAGGTTGAVGGTTGGGGGTTGGGGGTTGAPTGTGGGGGGTGPPSGTTGGGGGTIGPPSGTTGPPSGTTGGGGGTTGPPSGTTGGGGGTTGGGGGTTRGGGGTTGAGGGTGGVGIGGGG